MLVTLTVAYYREMKMQSTVANSSGRKGMSQMKTALGLGMRRLNCCDRFHSPAFQAQLTYLFAFTLLWLLIPVCDCWVCKEKCSFRIGGAVSSGTPPDSQRSRELSGQRVHHWHSFPHAETYRESPAYAAVLKA